MERELIFRNLEFEEKTRRELQEAQEAQQKLLDSWNETDIGIPCPNLFRLIHDPRGVYNEAVKSVAEIPIAHGKFQISKDAFLNVLEIPTPNDLYIAAREARRHIQCGRPELWSIENGKTVVLNKEKAEELIHSCDVWVENEKQKEFAEAALRYAEDGNYLVNTLRSMPGLNNVFSIPFTLVGKFSQLICAVQIEPNNFRALIEKL